MNRELSKIRRRMGYSSDQSGIMKRFINEEGGWDAHLNNTKDFIIKIVGNNKGKKVAVLGSGWLLDVPLDFLSSTFKHVFLFDICHPKQILYRLKKYPNVSAIFQDLTGNSISEIYNNRKTIKREGASWLNNLKIKDDISFHEYDFVISLNILNQLDVIIADYLKSKIGIKEKELFSLRKTLQSYHLASLPKGRSCLISDVSEIQIDEKGEVVKSKNLIHTDIEEVIIIKEWIWDFDSNYTYHEDYKTIFKVIAGKI